MSRPPPPVRWTPRLNPQQLRRLYERDAQGLLDDDLLDEVGYALYSRCQSILHVTDAMNGRVHCPECDTIIPHQGGDPAALVRCPACGWSTPWEAYAATYRTQELGAGGAAPFFREFIAQWERARTVRDKMLAVDRLIHRWHWETAAERPSFGLGRPTGVNLIEGNRKQVLALLDSLTYGAGSSADPATRERWRQAWQEVRERQTAGRSSPRPADPERPEGETA